MSHSFQSAPDFSSDYKARSENPVSLTVKEMDADSQPRERAAKFGIQSLSNAELFAIILRTGAQGYPITELCRDLMKRNENLIGNLERCSIEQLLEINGIGEMKALQIQAVMEIVRRYSREKVGDRIAIRSAVDIYNMMRPEIGYSPYEEMWAIFLNRANRVVGKMRVSSGGATSTVFDTKKVLRSAILAHAEGVALCHNHPSGTLSPSGPDDNITRRFSEGCKQLDLVFIDHVIVTTDGYYSYNDHSRMP